MVGKENIISIDEVARTKAVMKSESLARLINSLHIEFTGQIIKGLEKGVRIGELLRGQRLKLKHGQWIPWVHKYLEFSERTAQRYMRLYNNRHRLETDKVGNLTGAYRLLASPDKRRAKAPPPSWENISKKLQAIATSIDKKIKTEGLNIDETVKTAITMHLAYIHELMRSIHIHELMRSIKEENHADQ